MKTVAIERETKAHAPDAGRDDVWSEHVSYHKLVLLTSLCVLLLCFALDRAGKDAVRIPGWQQPLPEICLARRLWGASCPGCGLTRSMICLARGEVRESFRLNAAGPMLFLLLVAQIPYRICAIHRWHSHLPPLLQSPRALWPLGVIMTVMFLQWLIHLPPVWP